MCLRFLSFLIPSDLRLSPTFINKSNYPVPILRTYFTFLLDNRSPFLSSLFPITSSSHSGKEGDSVYSFPSLTLTFTPLVRTRSTTDTHHSTFDNDEGRLGYLGRRPEDDLESEQIES